MANIKKVSPNDIVFTDAAKHHRAKGIFGCLKGERPQAQLRSDYSTPNALEELTGKFREILAENKIDLKNEDEAILFIYKKLGGGVTTYEKQEKIKQSLKKFADSKKAMEDGDEVPDEDEDDPDKGKAMDQDDEE